MHRGHDRGRTREECTKAELADGGVEEHAPVGVVGVIELQNDWDMGTDVHCLDGVGRRARHRARSSDRGARRRRVLRIVRGEHRVVVYDCGSMGIDQKRVISVGH
jgi:hypothetical protein